MIFSVPIQNSLILAVPSAVYKVRWQLACYCRIVAQILHFSLAQGKNSFLIYSYFSCFVRGRKCKYGVWEGDVQKRLRLLFYSIIPPVILEPSSWKKGNERKILWLRCLFGWNLIKCILTFFRCWTKKATHWDTVPNPSMLSSVWHSNPSKWAWGTLYSWTE